MEDLRIVFTTCADEKDAANISRALLKADLAACCNIIPGVRSLYSWEGKIEDTPEVMLLIKTRAGKVKDIVFALEGLHKYDLPPIEVIDISKAGKAFTEWVLAETR